MRTLRGLAVGSMIALLAACNSSTEPRVIDPEVLAAPETFARIADSLYDLGVDASVSAAYQSLASVVRGDPGVSRVIISVDGVPAEYFATAQSFDQPYCPPAAICAAAYRLPLNSMIAWQRSDPRRVVQLTADGDFSGMGEVPPGTQVPYANRTTLTFLDGEGGIFFGVGATQGITVTPGDDFCAGPVDNGFHTMVKADPPLRTCRRAEFSVAFTGTVQPPPIALRKNTASGSHTISMTPQVVPGTILSSCGACGLGVPPMTPPISIMGNNSLLQPALRATANGRQVTLEFTVKNISSAPAQLDFNSAQQYDFIVRSAASGALLWQWSANMSFGQSLGSRTLAPGETVAYSEQWNAPAGGMYTADAMLTSSSHRATTSFTFVLP
ncbi:MAG: BsuPI-related putative proteinase inhibitor [Gemmatimonadaceae bacterium]